MEPLNRRLKRYRELKGLTIKQLCSKTQIPVTTYREWEYGRAITGEPYIKLAEALGISVYELLSGVSPQSDSIKYIDEIEKKLSLLKKNVESFF